MNKLIMVLLAGILLFGACNKKDNSNTPGGSSFDQGSLLTNMADNLIVPSYQDLSDQSDKLVTALSDFAANPNDGTLTAAQDQFTIAYKAYIHCEPYDFGPANSTVMLANAVNYWPAKPALINAELSAGGEVSDNYVSGLGAEKKGFPALAYLLFDISNSNTAIKDSFTVAGNKERRKAFAIALAQNIATNAKAVLQEWKDSYAASFRKNTGTSLNTSLSLLLNNFVINVETSKNKRLGIPIGRKDNFTETAIDPTAVELPSTDFAKSVLQESALTLQNIYLGKSANGDGTGFDDYVASLNADGAALNDSIKTEFNTFQTDLSSIVAPMQASIQADKTPVYNAWVETKKMLVLLKVDLASSLGILITFSDNDGD